MVFKQSALAWVTPCFLIFRISCSIMSSLKGPGAWSQVWSAFSMCCSRRRVPIWWREVLPPVFHCGKTPPAMLHPALGPPAYKGCGPVWNRFRRGHKDDQRTGACLRWRQAERVQVAQTREESVLGRPSSTFQYLKRGCKRAGEGLGTRTVVIGQRTMASKWKRIDLD